MEQLNKLLQNSEELLKLLSGTLPEGEESEEMMNKLHRLLDERQLIINRVSKPKGEEQQALAKKVVAMQQQINGLMEKHKGSLSVKLNKMKNRKVKTRKYSNPYDKVDTDGMFLDHKS